MSREKKERNPVWEDLLELLYPPKCGFCGQLVEKGEMMCPTCQRELPWLTGTAAEKQVELTGGCVAALRYEGTVREAVHAYKFKGRRGRSGVFGTLIAQAVKDCGYQVEVVTWPSLSPKRLRQRGYDQGELLAREVGKALGLPVERTLDKREVPAQSGLEGEAQRRANVLGAYEAVGAERFRGKTVLLVDDVVTSGATLAECAKVLRLAGAAEVYCAVLARAR